VRSVVVVGGGVIGLSCAYYLSRAGHKVTLLERGALHHDCCSLGNSGMVVPSHFEPLASPGMVGYGLRMMLRRTSPFGFKPNLDPDLVRWGWIFARSCRPANVERASVLLKDLHMASRDLHRELSIESKDAFELKESGMVMLCQSERALASELKVAEHAESLGLKVRRLTRLDVELLEPHTRVRGAGGVHFLDDCRLNPQALHAWLQTTVEDLGVDIRYGTSVDDVVVEGDKVKAVRSSHGDLSADEFVVAAGAWSGRLAKRFGFRMPLQGGKGYSMDVPVSISPQNCFILVEARVAVTPIGGKLRFGGTMEIVGDDLSVNQNRVRGIQSSVSRYLPDFQPDDFADLGIWSGLRPVSADGVPYIGRPGHLSNLAVASGHGMMGVSLAPITGKLISDVVAGDKPSIDLALMKPDRFG
jgi:D-amino-acid dehydrogenase